MALTFGTILKLTEPSKFKLKNTFLKPKYSIELNFDVKTSDEDEDTYIIKALNYSQNTNSVKSKFWQNQFTKT